MDGPPRPGQMSFPFSIHIPDWLPASMMLGGHWEDRMSVKYHLGAQFTPKNTCDWADDTGKISSFRGSTPIYLYRPTIQTP